MSKVYITEVKEHTRFTPLGGITKVNKHKRRYGGWDNVLVEGALPMGWYKHKISIRARRTTGVSVHIENKKGEYALITNMKYDEVRALRDLLTKCLDTKTQD